MNTKKLYLSLYVLALLGSGCSIKVANTRACGVAGKLSLGMDCAYTLSKDTDTMTFEETIAFLEPNEKRGGAICQSASDWNKNKTSLEQACKKLGNFCSYEMKQAIKAASIRINKLSPRIASGPNF